MTTRLLAVAISLAVSTAALAVEDGVERVARSIEDHVNSGDTDSLQEGCEQLAGLLEEKPADATRYALAFCHYRLATSLSAGGGETDLGALLEGAQNDLDAVIDGAPKDSEEAAEAIALQSAIMGFRIGLEPGLAMSLGSKSGQLIAKAERMAPENPRVLLQFGVSKFNTPKMFGGSMKKAEEALRKAVALFADQAASVEATTWPDWGYLDALAWLGQTLAAQGKIDEARAAYQQALAINPEMGWIKYQLLPELNQKSSG